MPEIRNKKIFAYSSEDPDFPAKNLLETKVTKKWKCQEVGEKNCFVVFKLDQPRQISMIEIGNENSGMIEVLVGNSLQDPPIYKEILLSTSFMTIIEARNGTNPHKVRSFTQSELVQSVAKQKWDLCKIICIQPFNNKLKYGLSFVTLRTPEEIANDESPAKISVVKPTKGSDSSEKKKLGKFTLRDSDSEDEKETTPFSRWKSSKENSQEKKVSIKEQLKTKIEESRKRIRLMSDSSDDEKPKAKAKPSRNRTAGLIYMDEDDEPNEKLQKKLDKDKETKEKEQKSTKLLSKRDISPTDSKRKFASFVSDDAPKDAPSTSKRDKSPKSSSRDKSPTRPTKPSFLSSRNKTPSPRQKRGKSQAKKVSYKPFNQLLQGVSFAFSGYVNPERGILRQKAIDMGAKYRPDWDSSCTHLICAFVSTPKYQQVKGKGKIVTKKWIEACYEEKKKLPWRRFALDRNEKDLSESEEEVHVVELKAKSPEKRKFSVSGSDDDMVVVDKRVKNGEEQKLLVIDDEPEKKVAAETQNVMEISTDDEGGINGSNCLTQAENQVFKDKIFYLNEDLSATDLIKLKTQIDSMMGTVTDKPSKANYIITTGKRIPEGITGELLTSLWVNECHELEAMIPTTRYKAKL